MFTITPLVKKGSTNLLNAMLVSLGLLLFSQTALAQEEADSTLKCNFCK